MGAIGRRDRASLGGFLAQLPRLHLAYRVVGRVRFGFLLPDRTRRRAALAVAFSIYDVAGAWWLSRNSDRTRFALRVLADSADMALWAGIEGEATDNVVTIGNTTCAEAGVRYGLGGLVVPCVQAGSVMLARRLAGKRTGLYPFTWSAVSMLAGWGLNNYERRRLGRLRASNDAELAARTERARLAGQHSVAMGADPIVDLLARTAPLLATDSIGPIQDPVQAWKAQLAQQARARATYLADAARLWALEHNSATPILADHVEIEIEPGGDQILLTAEQVLQFHRQVEQLGLTGEIHLEAIVTDVGHLAGRGLTLVANGRHRLTLAADGGTRPSPMDPAPLALAVMVIWFVIPSTSAYEHAPLSRTAPGALGALLAAAALYRQIARGGQDVADQALTISLLLAFVNTVSVSPAIRNDIADDGLQTHPSVSALFGPSILAAIYWPKLTRAQRVTVAASMAVIVGLELWLRPWPSRLRDLGAAVSLLATTVGAASGLGAVLDHQADLVAAEFASIAEESQQEAFYLGRCEVIDLVSGAIEATARRFDQVGDRLNPRLAALVRQRIEALRERITVLRSTT